MQKVAIFLLLIGTILLAGCSQPGERLVRVPNRDVVFSISVDKVADGQPIPHYISAILPDGSVATKTPLYTGKKNQSKLFEAQDNGTNILIIVRKGNRRTLWMVYTPSRTRFEDPRNLTVMTAAAAQAKVNIRDTAIFALP
jgi:hypothetical protein